MSLIPALPLTPREEALRKRKCGPMNCIIRVALSKLTGGRFRPYLEVCLGDAWDAVLLAEGTPDVILFFTHYVRFLLYSSFLSFPISLVGSSCRFSRLTSL